ncbi:trehalose-phosphatase [Janibacter anophelis]|uniref:trehalose-phosphatase n=1 Tax=Janibacter anophelis TaxID=319054 RepID=UPI0008350DF7|nr:trehalose-phosphatase [Janibacter anophelis]
MSVPLPQPVTAALESVAAAPRLLVATDFDGVLAPFVLDPLDARPQAGTIASLTELAAAEDTWTAVVSGRDLATLEQLTGLAGSAVTRIGSHGAESSSGTVLPEGTAAAVAALRERVEHAVADREPRIRLEHKPTAVVLHTRGLPPEVLPTAEAIAHEAADGDGVTLLTGKGVHELSVLRADKGTALRALAGTLEVDATLYLGDDVTDEHVFTVLGPRDLGIKVGPGETAARLRVDDCTLVPEVLAALSSLRS